MKLGVYLDFLLKNGRKNIQRLFIARIKNYGCSVHLAEEARYIKEKKIIR